MERSKIIYDYLSFTTRIHTVTQVIEMLGLQQVTWQNINGAHGYRDRLYFDKMHIHYNNDSDKGRIWVEFTGQGCRCFETIGNGDYEAIFNMARNEPQDVNITRLDVAFDDHEDYIDMNRLINDTVSQLYVAKTKVWETRLGNKGRSVNHGSEQSEIYIRIYDKALERKHTDGRHWIRVEMQMRDDRAKSFALLDKPLPEKFAGVLLNYLRYVNDDSAYDKNKSRWSIADYWANLIGKINALQIYEKPGVEYNMEKLHNFVFNIAGNGVDTAIKILGVDGFLKELSRRETNPNPKYQELIEQFRRAESGGN